MAGRSSSLSIASFSIFVLFLLHLPLRSSASGSPDAVAYVEWARSIGIDSSNVTTMPQSSILDSNRALTEIRTVHAALADVLQARFSPVETLTIFLMLKLADRELRGPEASSTSEFDVWIDMMPPSYHGIIMWSEEQVKLVSDERLVQNMREIWRQFAVLSEKVVQLLAGAPASARSIMKLLQLPQDRVLHIFKVATCIIQSRAFGEFRLVPVMDMLNYSPHSNMAPTWRENVEGFTGYVLHADKDYDAGEELQMFYGPKGNHNLVEMYGFALLDNPFNCAMLYPKFFDKYRVIKNRVARMLGADLEYGICVNAHMLSPALFVVSAAAILDVEEMPRDEYLRAASAPHTNPPLMARVLHNLLDGLKAAGRTEEQTINDFMHLSLIRRVLPRIDASSALYAEMFRRSVALTMNLENDNNVQGAVRALLVMQQQLQGAAQEP